MFTPVRPRARAISATVPGRFSTLSRSSYSSPPTQIGLQEPAAVLAGGAVPGRDAVAVTRSHHLRGLTQPLGGGVDLARDRLAVGGEDVPPDRRVRAGHPGRVAKARADLGQALGLLHRGGGRLLDEHVGDHVREVAHGGHQPIVGLRVDRLGTRAEVRDRPLEAVVVHPARALGRGQVPAGALEQVVARVLHARALGSRDRMAADEPPQSLVVREARDQLALGRADVGDDRVRATLVERIGHQGRKCADRPRAEDDLGALERLGDRLAEAIERPDLDAAARVRGLGVVADDLSAKAALCREPDRPADQPDAQDRYAHRALRLDGRQLLAGHLGDPPDLLGVLGEAVRRQGLRTVADRLFGLVVDLDDDPVGASGGRCQRHRADPVAAAGRVATDR